MIDIPAAWNGALVLWYRQPAETWVEALPIGNGRLGGMVFGKVWNERIQLNEDTVWAGETRDRINPEALKNLPEIRRLLFSGNPVEAQSLAERTMLGIPKRLPPYQPLGDLTLKFSGEGEVADYRRELDLDSGIAQVRFRLGDAQFSRTHPPATAAYYWRWSPAAITRWRFVNVRMTRSRISNRMDRIKKMAIVQSIRYPFGG